MPVSALTATLVPGAWASVFSAPMTCWRLALSTGVRASVLVPASIAGLMSGSASLSSAVAGASWVPSVLKSARKGRWTASDWVLTCSVEGDLAIVDSRSEGLWSIAWKVVAMSVNSWALVWATGATAPITPSRLLKKRVSSVLGSARYCVTGLRYPNSDGRLANVSLSADPRPAKVSPKPTRF